MTRETQEANEPFAPTTLSDATQELIHCISSAVLLDESLYRRKISQRFVDLEREKRALRWCQNALTPVCRLPTEVLSMIFLLLSRQHSVSDDPHWIVVTHVCQHWRNVAIGCAALWTKLEFNTHGEEFMALQLVRAANAPLSVYLTQRHEDEYFPPLHAESAFRDALSHPSRVRCVSIELSDEHSDCPDIETLFSSWSRVPASFLEELRIEDYRSESPLPSDFLAAGAPLLRSLDLVGHGLPWQGPRDFPQLTHLNLTFCERGPESPNLTRSIVAAVRHIHTLEQLELHNIVDDYDPPFSDSTLTELSTLRALILKDTPSRIANFFGMVSCPNLLRIDLSLRRCVDQAPDIDRALKNLWTSRQPTDRGSRDATLDSPCRMEVGQEEGKVTYVTFPLCLWFREPLDEPTMSSSGLDTPVAEPQLKIEFIEFMSKHSMDLEAYMDMTIGRLHLASLSTLDINCKFQNTLDRDTNFWTTSIKDLPKLRTLTIRHTTDETIRDLGRALKTSEDNHDLRTTFPSLSKIVLIEFDEDVDGGIIDTIGDALHGRPNIKELAIEFEESVDFLGPRDFKDLCRRLPDVHILWIVPDWWPYGSLDSSITMSK